MCLCGCVRARARVCVWVCVCQNKKDVYVRVCMCACARVCLCLRVCVCLSVCFFVYHIYVHTYILEQTYIQAHVHTYSYKLGLLRSYPCRCRLSCVVAYAHLPRFLRLSPAWPPFPSNLCGYPPARQDPAASDSGWSSRAIPPSSPRLFTVSDSQAMVGGDAR